MGERDRGRGEVERWMDVLTHLLIFLFLNDSGDSVSVISGSVLLSCQ